MKVKALVWLGVKTPHFDTMTALFKVMGLETYHEDGLSSRFRLANQTEVHVYSSADPDHDFFGSGPVVGFLVDDLENAKTEMEAAGVTFVGPVQRSETHSWNHFYGPDGNVYELMAER